MTKHTSRHLESPETGEQPVATVYIATLLGGDRLASCLEALLAQTVPIEIVVADNGDGEGCQELIAARFPSVTRLAFGRNLGFGPALNRAISSAGDGPIILLNDDAIANPDFVERLIERWNESQVAMVAAVLLNLTGNIDSAGIDVDDTMQGFDYLNGYPLADASLAENPFGPTGGGALYDRTAFNSAGGFDEEIFLYYEDVDLATRLRDKGGRCILAPAAIATHGYSETLGPRSPRKYLLTGWSRGYLIGRYRVTASLPKLLKVLIIELSVCFGQLILDRSATGIKGRIEGWRVGRALPARPTPAGATKRSIIHTLKLKLSRRVS